MGIINSNYRFFDIRQWYLKLAILERQICRVEVIRNNNPQAYGTGFLVGPDIVITAYHVISDIKESIKSLRLKPESVTFRFDYTLSNQTNQKWSNGTVFHLTEEDWLIDYSNDEELDYVLLRVSNNPGNQPVGKGSSLRGWVEIAEYSYELLPKTPLIILQYPMGESLQMALDTQGIIEVNEHKKRLFYKTNTLPGSAGAPCFDMNWQLVAIHIGRTIDFIGQYRNQGILVQEIIKNLKGKDIFDLVSKESPQKVDFVNHEAEMLELIANGESQMLEFKETICRDLNPAQPDIRQGKKKDIVQHQKDIVVRTVAGFMNSKDGGTLLIGISDQGEIKGINEEEYLIADRQRGNSDGYYSFLNNIIESNLSIENSFNYYKIVYKTLNDKDIWCIYISPADRPVYFQKKLYLRVGNKTKELQGPDLVDYVNKRWKK